MRVKSSYSIDFVQYSLGDKIIANITEHVEQSFEAAHMRLNVSTSYLLSFSDVSTPDH